MQSIVRSCYEPDTHQASGVAALERNKPRDPVGYVRGLDCGLTVEGILPGALPGPGADCLIVEHVWLFSTFRLRELQEIAAEEASASDLIIVSVHQSESLPEEVQSWIDLWLRPTVRHPAVLLALLDPEGEDAPNGVQAYLQDAARRGGVEFLVETEE